jgi:hypothetical protein
MGSQGNSSFQCLNKALQIFLNNFLQLDQQNFRISCFWLCIYEVESKRQIFVCVSLGLSRNEKYPRLANLSMISSKIVLTHFVYLKLSCFISYLKLV